MVRTSRKGRSLCIKIPVRYQRHAIVGEKKYFAVDSLLYRPITSFKERAILQKDISNNAPATGVNLTENTTFSVLKQIKLFIQISTMQSSNEYKATMTLVLLYQNISNRITNVTTRANHPLITKISNRIQFYG